MIKTGASILLPSLLLPLGLLLFCAGTASALPPLPDLSVSLKIVGLNDRNVVGGDVGPAVKITVNNKGQAAVPGYKLAVVFSTAPVISSQPTPHSPVTTGRLIGLKDVAHSLIPAGSETVTVEPLPIPADVTRGLYFLTVLVDPADSIAESVETNNRGQVKLNIMADAVHIEPYYSSGGVFVWFGGKGFGPWVPGLVARLGSVTVPIASQNWTAAGARAFPAPELIPVGKQYETTLLDGTARICRTKNMFWGIFLSSANPPAATPGTQVMLGCYNCQTQGTKKLVLQKQDYQFAAEVPIVFWSNGQLVGTIPDVPPGVYYYMIMDGGQLITTEWKLTVKVI